MPYIIVLVLVIAIVVVAVRRQKHQFKMDEQARQNEADKQNDIIVNGYEEKDGDA